MAFPSPESVMNAASTHICVYICVWTFWPFPIPHFITQLHEWRQNTFTFIFFPPPPSGTIQTESVTFAIRAHPAQEGKTQTLTPCRKLTPERRVCGAQREWRRCKGVWGSSHSSSDLFPSSADRHTSHPLPSWTPAERRADTQLKCVR